MERVARVPNANYKQHGGSDHTHCEWLAHQQGDVALFATCHPEQSWSLLTAAHVAVYHQGPERLLGR
jgi:hypothetical protein